MIRAALDWAIWPLVVLASLASAHVLLAQDVPPLFVTPIAVGAIAGLVALLERLHPERVGVPRDYPLWQEAAHFVFDFEVGYGVSLAACELVGRGARALLPIPGWPTHWPMALQIFVAVLVYEGTSYWQHRALHVFPRLWRFHALHHSGARLDFTRAVRFHAVDIGTASFVAYAPLVIFAAPDDLFARMGVLLSALGILQHANVRMRTPRWLGKLVCTPAVHRHHHSAVRAEGDTNYGNTVMLFDLLFGTFGDPPRPIPETIGIDGDPVPKDFWGQLLGPLRSSRSPTIHRGRSR